MTHSQREREQTVELSCENGRNFGDHVRQTDVHRGIRGGVGGGFRLRLGLDQERKASYSATLLLSQSVSLD